MTDMKKVFDIYFGLEGLNHGNRQSMEKLAIDEATTEIKKEIYGTRRPTTRAERRKETRKHNRHLRDLTQLTGRVRLTRNGGVVRCGDTYRYDWAAAENKRTRHEGKRVCYSYIPETQKGNELPYVHYWESDEWDSEDWDGGDLWDEDGNLLYDFYGHYIWEWEYDDEDEDHTCRFSFAELEEFLKDYGYTDLLEKDFVQTFVNFIIDRR